MNSKDFSENIKEYIWVFLNYIIPFYTANMQSLSKICKGFTFRFVCMEWNGTKMYHAKGF